MYRVSRINGPDGRVIDSFTRLRREDAETVVLDLCRQVGEDELVVFEMTDAPEMDEPGYLTDVQEAVANHERQRET